MNTRRVREELALRNLQNGGLTTQHDMEKRRKSFLIWATFDRNFNLQMGKSFNFISFYVFFMIRDDPSRSELIRP